MTTLGIAKPNTTQCLHVLCYTLAALQLNALAFASSGIHLSLESHPIHVSDFVLRIVVVPIFLISIALLTLAASHRTDFFTWEERLFYTLGVSGLALFLLCVALH